MLAKQALEAVFCKDIVTARVDVILFYVVLPWNVSVATVRGVRDHPSLSTKSRLNLFVYETITNHHYYGQLLNNLR